jgi:hypothetical protein
MRRSLAFLLAAFLAIACGSPGPTRSPGPHDPIDAARAFLELDSARFEMRQDRWKPDLPIERQWDATGIVDPHTDRGSMEWTMAPWVEGGEVLSAEIRWDATDYWVSAATDADVWRHAPRERARGVATIGRVNEEPLALIRLVASASPDHVTRLETESLHGTPAQRWRVAVSIEQAKAAFVPPDSYAAVDLVFGITEFPIEIWLQDGQIVRSGHVLSRAKAPYGGPDRFDTYYDWSALGDPIELTVPPEGTIEEIDP